jgi:hypothetical protein
MGLIQVKMIEECINTNQSFGGNTHGESIT